jgi:hypothetical protein
LHSMVPHCADGTAGPPGSVLPGPAPVPGTRGRGRLGALLAGRHRSKGRAPQAAEPAGPVGEEGEKLSTMPETLGGGGATMTPLVGSGSQAGEITDAEAGLGVQTLPPEIGAQTQHQEGPGAGGQPPLGVHHTARRKEVATRHKRAGAGAGGKGRRGKAARGAAEQHEQEEEHSAEEEEEHGELQAPAGGWADGWLASGFGAYVQTNISVGSCSQLQSIGSYDRMCHPLRRSPRAQHASNFLLAVDQ